MLRTCRIDSVNSPTRNFQCGHDALSPHAWVNVVLGMGLHTFVLTPYFAWRITHRSHHVRMLGM